MTRRGRILALGVVLLAVCGAEGAGAASAGKGRLAAIRGRLRAEARSREPSPASRAFTVLPGDTYARLAEDLTGTRDTEVALRKIGASLKPGATIELPEAMLLPGLADTRHDPLVFGRPFPTMWSVARQTTARTPAEVGRMARNLQRLNAILYPERLTEGTKILVPRSLLAPAGEAPAEESQPPPEPVPAAAPERPRADPRFLAERPTLEIRREFRTADLRGLERTAARVPQRLRRPLSEKEAEQCLTGRGEVSLVVVHTTEHQGGTFENTASYIQRKRLANYLIGPDGAVYEIVPEEYRAYGCGDSLWEGRYGVDLEAINVEVFANTAPGERKDGITGAQYEGLRALVADIRARRAAITEQRVVTHRMVALSYKFGFRSRKGDPYEFDWARAGLPDNSTILDPDVLAGRATLCTDDRYSDRITPGQTEAARLSKRL